MSVLRRFDGEGEGVGERLAGGSRAGTLEDPSAATGKDPAAAALAATGEDSAEAGTEAEAEAALVEAAEVSP